MKIPVKNLTSGFSLPVYGLGTWTMGGAMEQDMDNDDAVDVAAIHQALEMGVRHIDTAELYANGHTEEIVGRAISDVPRKELFLTSKVSQAHLGYSDVMSSCQRSLDRLGTDYIDLYLIHAPNPDIPITETLRAFDALIEEGLIKHIGTSNFSKERFIETQQYTKNNLVTNQVHYNLKYRQAERTGFLDYCQGHDVILTAFRPIERGLLTGPSISLLNELGKKYEKTAAQIALNWLISQKNVVVICKTTSAFHLSENVGAIGWELEQQDRELLRNSFPGQEEISGSPMR
jgi:diketogulonate reductase-like aldo/keto reductase